MSFALLQPWFLLAVLLVGLIWIGRWRARDRAHGLVRSMLLLLLAVSLAGPVLVNTAGARPTHVFILDASASADQSSMATTAQRLVSLAEAADDAHRVLITIGSAEQPGLASAFDEVVAIAPDTPAGSSPIGPVLQRAAGMIPADAGGAIVLASDGTSTRSDDGRWLADVRRRGIPVHVMPLARSAMLRPVDLRWHGELRVGATATLAAVLAGRAVSPCIVKLEGEQGRLLASAALEPFDGRTEIPLTFEPTQGGFLDVVLSIEDADGQRLSELTLNRTLPIREPRRLLYVGGRQRNGADRLAQLIGPGFEVNEAPLDDAQQCTALLDQAELVILDDASAPDVPPEVQRAIAQAVRDDGMGLMMSGGRSSFGTGGWQDTPIESLLPVELVQKEEKRDPSTTLVIVIDTSGSMSGQRVQLAKEVARLAIRRLMPHDKVGLVEFYGAKRWAAPIQPASNSIEIERAINRLDAGGGTVILPAIEEAFYGMQNVDTRYKHVLVLTDGGVEAGAFEPLLRRMAAEGINTSTVLVGGGIHSEFLVNLANWGKGRFYSVPDRFNLPEIIFKQPSSAKLPAYREGTHVVQVRAGRGWWGDADLSNLPNLLGYVETRARPEAEVLLATRDDQHPIVATWRYGLGRVTTFATEPVGEGTGEWSRWQDYGHMLARLLERTAADGRDAFDFTVVPDGGDILVTATCTDRRQRELQPIVERITDEGGVDAVMLTRRSPDTWQARLLSPPHGGVAAFWCGEQGSAASRRPLVAHSTTRDELQCDPVEALDAAVVAGLTGGRVLDDNTRGLPGSDIDKGASVFNLMPWMLGLSLLLFLIDIAWRRRPT